MNNWLKRNGIRSGTPLTILVFKRPPAMYILKKLQGYDRTSRKTFVWGRFCVIICIYIWVYIWILHEYLCKQLQICTYIYVFIARSPQDKKSADEALKSKKKTADLLRRAKNERKFSVSRNWYRSIWSSPNDCVCYYMHMYMYVYTSLGMCMYLIIYIYTAPAESLIATLNFIKLLLSRVSCSICLWSFGTMCSIRYLALTQKLIGFHAIEIYIWWKVCFLKLPLLA